MQFELLVTNQNLRMIFPVLLISIVSVGYEFMSHLRIASVKIFTKVELLKLNMVKPAPVLTTLSPDIAT